MVALFVIIDLLFGARSGMKWSVVVCGVAFWSSVSRTFALLYRGDSGLMDGRGLAFGVFGLLLATP
jgi:hypothetical protein